MTTEFRHLSLRVAGKARRQVYNGREHLVVPVVALMEGVIHAVNATVPEFVPYSTLSRNVEQWNGRPLMLGHPVKEGVHIAANSPTVLEAQCFGSIFNARADPVKRRLLVDAYVDPERLRQLKREDLLALCEEGGVIEVSVGANVGTDPTPGTFNGKPYKAKWAALGGDHLAFLPDSRGACSVEMGCGAHRAACANPGELEVLEVGDEGPAVSPPLMATIVNAVYAALGGKGSGHFGHKGRPGEVGGSSPDGAGGGGPASQARSDALATAKVRLKEERGALALSTEKGWAFEAKVAKQEAEKLERLISKMEGGGGPSAADTKPGSLVRIAPAWRDSPADADVLYTVIEDNGDRLFVRAVDPISKGGRLHAQELVRREMIEPADPASAGPGVFGHPRPERMPPDDDPDHGETSKYFEPAEAGIVSEGELARERKSSKAGSVEHGAGKSTYGGGPFVPRHRSPLTSKAIAGAKKKPWFKLLESKDCPMCQGSGSHDHNPCEACDGTGVLRTAEQGDLDMTRKVMIDRLTSCACSGFTPEHLKMLEAATDDQLVAFVVAADAKEDEDEEARKKREEDEKKKEETRAAAARKAAELKAAENAKRSLEEKVASLESELRAAGERQLTDEEFHKRAPDSIRALIADKRSQDEAEQATLITSLKAASDKGFTEAELKAMPLPELRKLAAFAKVDVDYSGRGIPVLRAAASNTSTFAPPDGYSAALAARK